MKSKTSDKSTALTSHDMKVLSCRVGDVKSNVVGLVDRLRQTAIDLRFGTQHNANQSLVHICRCFTEMFGFEVMSLQQATRKSICSSAGDGKK